MAEAAMRQAIGRGKNAERVEELVRDGRHAWRALRRAPGFTVAIVATLALGITAAASVLRVAYGILLRPLPVRDQGRVVVWWGDNPTHAPQHIPLSFAEVDALSRDAPTL